MAKRPTVGIVGCGRAGGSIALALRRAGYLVPAVWSRTRAGRMRAARLLDAPVLADPAEVVRSADVVIVAVPDEAIAEVAERVAVAARRGRRIAHTSGVVSVDALDPLRGAGMRTASLHPLQTLPDPLVGADALGGAGVAVTCDDADRRWFHRLAAGWGGRPFALADDAKVLYHAAAVFASNNVVSSLWAATRLFEHIGIPHARGLLGPLAAAAVENVMSSGAASAITGPVARGDLAVVRRHAEALGDLEPEVLRNAYGAMAMLTASVAGKDPTDVAEALA